MRLSNMGDYEKSFFKEIYRELLEESVNSRLSSKEYDTVVDMLDQIGIDKYTLDVMQGFNEWER
jgi:predicted glycosyltransferase